MLLYSPPIIRQKIPGPTDMLDKDLSFIRSIVIGADGCNLVWNFRFRCHRRVNPTLQLALERH